MKLCPKNAVISLIYLTLNVSLVTLPPCLILTHTTTAIALQEPEVNAIAAQITARIDGTRNGSGVIVDKQGSTYYVLTNWHVVNRDRLYQLQTPDGQRYQITAAQIQTLPGVDLALISFTSEQNYRVAQLGSSKQVYSGQPVYVAGWPGVGLGGKRIFLTTSGVIKGRQPVATGGYSLAYTNLVRVGMSGGPVLDQQGRVIAINGQVTYWEDTDEIVGRGIDIEAYLNWRSTAR